MRKEPVEEAAALDLVTPVGKHAIDERWHACGHGSRRLVGRDDLVACRRHQPQGVLIERAERGALLAAMSRMHRSPNRQPVVWQTIDEREGCGARQNPKDLTAFHRRFGL